MGKTRPVTGASRLLTGHLPCTRPVLGTAELDLTQHSYEPSELPRVTGGETKAQRSNHLLQGAQTCLGLKGGVRVRMQDIQEEKNGVGEDAHWNDRVFTFGRGSVPLPEPP